MATIFKTSRAQIDAVHIWVYIAKDNITAADNFIDQIEERLRQLAQNPLVAKAVPHIGNNIHQSIIGKYSIYYRPITEGIQVIRILHGARQPEDLM